MTEWKSTNAEAADLSETLLDDMRKTMDYFNCKIFYSKDFDWPECEQEKLIECVNGLNDSLNDFSKSENVVEAFNLEDRKED